MAHCSPPSHNELRCNFLIHTDDKHLLTGDIKKSRKQYTTICWVFLKSLYCNKNWGREKEVGQNKYKEKATSQRGWESGLGRLDAKK